ncbi:MAG: flagellar basal body P-ring protein FlgI, partial [Pseudomonadota bacterium]
AISQGNLTLRIREAPLAVQPSPFGDGETVVLPRTQAEIEDEEGTGLAIVDEAVSLAALVEGLNALGVSTRDMIDILGAIKAAGALHAEFVIQ